MTNLHDPTEYDRSGRSGGKEQRRCGITDRTIGECDPPIPGIGIERRCGICGTLVDEQGEQEESESS